jgi:hypothetical protein
VGIHDNTIYESAKSTGFLQMLHPYDGLPKQLSGDAPTFNTMQKMVPRQCELPTEHVLYNALSHFNPSFCLLCYHVCMRFGWYR